MHVALIGCLSLLLSLASLASLQASPSWQNAIQTSAAPTSGPTQELEALKPYRPLRASASKPKYRLWFESLCAKLLGIEATEPELPPVRLKVSGYDGDEAQMHLFSQSLVANWRMLLDARFEFPERFENGLVNVFVFALPQTCIATGDRTEASQEKLGLQTGILAGEPSVGPTRRFPLPKTDGIDSTIQVWIAAQIPFRTSSGHNHNWGLGLAQLSPQSGLITSVSKRYFAQPIGPAQEYFKWGLDGVANVDEAFARDTFYREVTRGLTSQGFRQSTTLFLQHGDFGLEGRRGNGTQSLYVYTKVDFWEGPQGEIEIVATRLISMTVGMVYSGSIERHYLQPVRIGLQPSVPSPFDPDMDRISSQGPFL